MARITISSRALGAIALVAMTGAHATDTPYADMEPALRRVCEAAPRIRRATSPRRRSRLATPSQPATASANLRTP